MPMPKVKPKQTKDEYIAECMSDEIMKKDFPKSSQRIAVCVQNWQDRDKD